MAGQRFGHHKRQRASHGHRRNALPGGQKAKAKTVHEHARGRDAGAPTTNPKNVRSVLTSEEVALSKAASLSSSGTSDSMPSSTAMLERASRCSKGALCRSNRNAAYEARVRKTGAQVTGYFLKIFFNRSQTM